MAGGTSNVIRGNLFKRVLYKGSNEIWEGVTLHTTIEAGCMSASGTLDLLHSS